MTLHLALESTLIKTINKPFIVVDFKAPTHLSLYFDLSVIYCSNLNRQIFVYHIFIESIQHFSYNNLVFSNFSCMLCTLLIIIFLTKFDSAIIFTSNLHFGITIQFYILLSSTECIPFILQPSNNSHMKILVGICVN